MCVGSSIRCGAADKVFLTLPHIGLVKDPPPQIRLDYILVFSILVENLVFCSVPNWAKIANAVELDPTE